MIAYALAGTMDFDFDAQPLGQDSEGQDVYLKDIWPDATEVQSTIDSSIDTDMFTKQYKTVFDGDELVPFHKLTGWTTYSLLEPLEKILGWKFEGVEDMTGLPEYRNGKAVTSVNAWRIHLVA